MPIVDDSDIENDETFIVTLSNPSGAVLGTAVATGTIIDDDTPDPTTPGSTLTVTAGQELVLYLSVDITSAGTPPAREFVVFASGGTAVNNAETSGGHYTMSAETVTLDADTPAPKRCPANGAHPVREIIVVQAPTL